MDVGGAVVHQEMVVQEPFGRASGESVYVPAAGIDKIVVEIDRDAQPVLVVVNICLGEVETVTLVVSYERAAQVGITDTCADGPAGRKVELETHAQGERQGEVHFGTFVVNADFCITGGGAIAAETVVDAAALAGLNIAERQHGNPAVGLAGHFFLKGQLVQKGIVVGLLGLGGYFFRSGLFRSGGLGGRGFGGLLCRRGDVRKIFRNSGLLGLCQQMRFHPGRLYGFHRGHFLYRRDFCCGHGFPGCLRHKY